MTITEDQLAGLREGDVIRFRHRAWPTGAYQEGPLFNSGGRLQCGSMPLVSWAHAIAEFEIVKKAPRFYANADRTPAIGDVAFAGPLFRVPNVGPWFYTDRGWISRKGVTIGGSMPDEENILVWDGIEQKAVPVDSTDGGMD